jgi:D-3-phosphoglycerate dehydrogenase
VIWGVGYGNIDIGAATAGKLPVVTLPVFLASIAEAVIYFLFSITKKYDQLYQLVRMGNSPSLQNRSAALEGKVLGCVGFGRIGGRVARIALALDMEVLVYDPYIEAAMVEARQLPLVSLEDLLRQSDFVSLHAPLTPETHHMINTDMLALMKPGAYLINVARGALVDEAALYQAIVEGRLAGAALDVFEEEPVSPQNPLLSLNNVWATPHYLGATWEGLAQVASAAQDATLKLIHNEPINYQIVNPEIYGDKR